MIYIIINIYSVNQHTFTHGLTFHPPISSPKQCTSILATSSYSARAARPWVKSHRTVATKQKTFSRTGLLRSGIVGPSLKRMI